MAAPRYSNNSNNSWYVSMVNGNVNNNNANNRYLVLPVRDLSDRYRLFFDAEERCWKNKHSSLDATRFHYHIGRIFDLADRVLNREYVPGRNVCFVKQYPVPREIFAALYEGRITHHIVAPYIQHIANCVHTNNGNVSHGNRLGYSSMTAALQIQELMRKHPNGIVGRYDVMGFFMNSDRRIVLDAFDEFVEIYGEGNFSEDYLHIARYLTPLLILHDPTEHYVKRCRDDEWDLVPVRKSLIKLRLLYPDKPYLGAPIGNFHV